jgi:hypothetical protein
VAPRIHNEPTLDFYKTTFLIEVFTTAQNPQEAERLALTSKETWDGWRRADTPGDVETVLVGLNELS